MSDIADSRTAKAVSVARLDLERLVRSPGVLIETLPIGIYVCDRHGTLVQFNRRAAELWGQSPALGSRETRFGAVARILDHNGVAVAPEALPMAVAIRSGQAVRDHELVLEKRGGDQV